MSKQERKIPSGLPETTKTDESNMAEVVDLLRYKLANGHVATIAKAHACGTNRDFSEQEEKILELIRVTDGVRNSA